MGYQLQWLAWKIATAWNWFGSYHFLEMHMIMILFVCLLVSQTAPNSEQKGNMMFEWYSSPVSYVFVYALHTRISSSKDNKLK